MELKNNQIEKSLQLLKVVKNYGIAYLWGEVRSGKTGTALNVAKPSVGGQSQRLIFSQHSGLDCIVHFHCPLKSDHVDDIPVVSQREYECGSHQCGQNTSNGLAMFRNGIACVMLDKHGPNIVFNHSIDPQEVIDFISDNFDLSQKTDGFERVVFEKLAEHE